LLEIVRLLGNNLIRESTPSSKTPSPVTPLVY
jgi:hypothetical protein